MYRMTNVTSQPESRQVTLAVLRILRVEIYEDAVKTVISAVQSLFVDVVFLNNTDPVLVRSLNAN